MIVDEFQCISDTVESCNHLASYALVFRSFWCVTQFSSLAAGALSFWMFCPSVVSTLLEAIHLLCDEGCLLPFSFFHLVRQFFPSIVPWRRWLFGSMVGLTRIDWTWANPRWSCWIISSFLALFSLHFSVFSFCLLSFSSLHFSDLYLPISCPYSSHMPTTAFPSPSS